MERNIEYVEACDSSVDFDKYSIPEHSHTQRVTLEMLSSELDRLIDFSDARAARAMQKKVMGRGRLLKEASLFFSESNQFITRFRDARKVNAISKNLELIATNHMKFGSIVSTPPARQTLAWSLQTVRYSIIPDVLIGREEDKNNIISMLSNDSMASESLSVYSIIGIGGVGKTALAHFVYRDEKVRHRFDVQFWVDDVGEDFNVKKILLKILAYAVKEELFNCDMNQLCHLFLRAIGGKRFLLVLDNIWDQPELRHKWVDLRDLFLRVGAYGSKILITARDRKVVMVMDSCQPYLLGDLKEQDSWLLFEHFAFTQSQDPRVKEIGEEIVKMCPNVPLVLRSIGCHLARKRTIQEWKAFRNDQLANVASYGVDIMQTLKLSYDQLDPRLKRCVKYCSLFPKGFVYAKEELINLWVALEYVQPQYKNQSLEEVGEEYLLSLLDYGFFIICSENVLHDFTSVRLQDVMYELVVSLAGFKYKRADSNTNEFDKRVRHVSIGEVAADSSWEVPSSLFKINHLESFIGAMDPECEIEVRNWSICGKLIRRFQFLKVLVLKGLQITELPTSLGELICLRYLNFSESAIVKLPNSITRLVNLLSLHLYDCRNLEELPKDFSKLVNLRHLQLKGSTDKLWHMPMGFNNLTNLRTLDMFLVSEPSSHEANVGGLAELNGLKYLEGNLSIEVRRESKDIVLDEPGARDWNMKEKLKQFYVSFWYGTLADARVLEHLQPHANLKVLKIKGYGGDSLPSWIYSQLPNLVSIRLEKFRNCRHLCSFRKLPHLRQLFLLGLENVEYIESDNDTISNNYEFIPSLSVLVVYGMPRLKGWRSTLSTSGSQVLELNQQTCPQLKSLTVDNVDLAITLVSGCTSLENLWIKKKILTQQIMQPNSLLNSCFPHLKQLGLDVIEEMEFLPDALRDFSSLEKLEIWSCKQLQALPDWIDSLISLKTLYISDCPKLESLPQQIRNLSNLNSLSIVECSNLLEERCRNPNGDRWPFIRHIFHSRITTSWI